MNTWQNVHNDSGNKEYGTPAPIIEAARRAMGSIDLDVASAGCFNKTVQAARYISIRQLTRWYHKRPSGLDVPWTTIDGRPVNAWMNHPFGRAANPLWIDKVLSEWEAGNVKRACVLTFAEQSSSWGVKLSRFPRWIPKKRIGFVDRYGRQLNGAGKGIMVTGVGVNLYEFCKAFYYCEIPGGVDYRINIQFNVELQANKEDL